MVVFSALLFKQITPASNIALLRAVPNLIKIWRPNGRFEYFVEWEIT